MKVSEAMSHDVYICSPDDTIQSVAQKMRDGDFGSVPVGSREALQGTITDRDIAIRAVAAGKGGDTKVREIMTTNIITCSEDDSTDEVADLMREHQVRRLPVLDRNKRVVGIVALGDLAIEESKKTAGATLRDVSQPGKSAH